MITTLALTEAVRGRLARDNPTLLTVLDDGDFGGRPTAAALSSVREIVIATVLEMGFHIGKGDEVCDPRPAPSLAPTSNGFRTRRRGGRR